MKAWKLKHREYRFEEQHEKKIPAKKKGFTVVIFSKSMKPIFIQLTELSVYYFDSMFLLVSLNLFLFLIWYRSYWFTVLLAPVPNRSNNRSCFWCLWKKTLNAYMPGKLTCIYLFKFISHIIIKIFSSHWFFMDSAFVACWCL